MYVDRYSIIVESFDGRKITIPLKDAKLNVSADGRENYEQESSTEIKNKAFLEQIDFVTCGYSNKEAFLVDLYKAIDIPFAPKDVYISYRSNGEDKKMDMIFANDQLRRTALQVVINKKKGVAKADVVNNDYVNSIIVKLKSLVQDEEVRKFMGRKRVFPYIVGKDLEDYCNTLKSESTTRQAELDDINASLKRHVSSFKNLRSIIVWFDMLEQRLAKKQQPIPTEDQQMSIVDYLEFKDLLPELDDQEALTAEEEKQLEEYAIESAELKDKVDRISKMTNLSELSEMITDANAKLAFEEANGDAEQIIETLGYDKASSLSPMDKFICGINESNLIKYNR